MRSRARARRLERCIPNFLLLVEPAGTTRSQYFGRNFPIFACEIDGEQALTAEVVRALQLVALWAIQGETMTNDTARPVMVTIPLSADERAREIALRARFAKYWTTATGAPRATSTRSFRRQRRLLTTFPLSVSRVKGWWARPHVAKDGGVILHVHGGGYVQGSADAFRDSRVRSRRAPRRPVFVLDYPLAPEATLPAATDAVMAAYEWLQANGVASIALVGDSAGGGLALGTLSRLARRDRALRPSPASCSHRGWIWRSPALR